MLKLVLSKYMCLCFEILLQVLTNKNHILIISFLILCSVIIECKKVFFLIFREQLPKSNSSLKDFINVSYCHFNVSQCDVTENSKRVIINVYNSLAKYINKFVRVPVLKKIYRLFDPSGLVIIYIKK